MSSQLNGDHEKLKLEGCIIIICQMPNLDGFVRVLLYCHEEAWDKIVDAIIHNGDRLAKNVTSHNATIQKSRNIWRQCDGYDDVVMQAVRCQECNSRLYTQQIFKYWAIEGIDYIYTTSDRFDVTKTLKSRANEWIRCKPFRDIVWLQQPCFYIINTTTQCIVANK